MWSRTILEALQRAIMSTDRSTSILAWTWVIEALASSKEIHTSLLIDLVKLIPPEVSGNMGRNARELVLLRILESLYVKEISNASNDVSTPGDKIEINPSICCEDILQRLFSEVSPNQMARPELLKWDVQSYIDKKRSSFPVCALQRIKDAFLDSANPLCASLKAKSGLEAVDLNGLEQNHEVRGGDASIAHEGVQLVSNSSDPCINSSKVINIVRVLNGIEQSHEVEGTDVQHEDVVPSGNTNVMQETQSRTLVPSKRSIGASTAHERENTETDPISERSDYDPCVKASKKVKPRSDAAHDCNGSQREGVATELSAGMLRATVQDGNLESGPSKMVISEEKMEENVGSHSNACGELRTSSGQEICQDSRIHGTEPAMEGNEAEFSSDSDECHNEMTALCAKKNAFVNSQCTQSQDSMATVSDTELSRCMKCNESGQVLLCSSETCHLLVHESCLGSAPSFDNFGNFYCPFCAYSRAMSEYQQSKKMMSLARKDFRAFMGW